MNYIYIHKEIITVMFVVEKSVFSYKNFFGYPFLFCFSLSTKEDLHKSSFIYTVISLYQTECDEIGLRVALRLFQSFIQKYTLPFKSTEFL